MSFAATIHNGCRSFVAFFIMCIIWIVFMVFYLARSLCTCVFILHSSPFLLRKGQTYCKSTNIFWISYQILAFSAYDSPKMTLASSEVIANSLCGLENKHKTFSLLAYGFNFYNFDICESWAPFIYNRRQYHRGGRKFGIRGRGIYFYNIYFTTKVTTYNLFISNLF